MNGLGSIQLKEGQESTWQPGMVGLQAANTRLALRGPNNEATPNRAGDELAQVELHDRS